MRVFRWLSCGVFVLGALGVVGMCAALAQSTADTVYHLHGSVVNAVTGKPIGRALVTSMDRRLATMTNSEGNFSLDVSVPAAEVAAQQQNSRANSTTFIQQSGNNAAMGTVARVTQMLSLSAQRPGFLQDQAGRPVTLTADTVSSAIVLRLYPSATVQGQVFAAAQDFTRGLTVLLLHHSVLNGRYVWGNAGAKPVAADGSFRFADLAPGEYSVMTAEWDPEGNAAASLTAVTQQYPPVFLGNVSTLAAASKLQLTYGQVAQANLQPQPAHYFPVHVPVQGLAANTSMNVRVTRGDSFNGFQLGWNGRNSTVEGSLPDGDYTLTLNSFGNPHSFASLPLHVAGAPLNLAGIALSPAQDIAVRVHDERTEGSKTPAAATMENRSLADGFGLYFRPENPADGLPGGVVQTRNGSLMLQNLVAGSYRAEAMGWRGYVASLSSGHTDLLRDPLVVGSTGADPIDVTLRDDGGTVRGTVSATEGAGSMQLILLLPTDGSTRVLQSIAMSGRAEFVISNVPPGEYRAVALVLRQSLQSVAFQDPEVRRMLDGKGARVTVTPGATSTLTVPLLPESADGGGQ